jgi:hypothetical protein
VPVYYQPNGVHNQTMHHQAETGVQNEQAVLLNHLLGVAAPMLEPPASSYEVAGDELRVSVTFGSGPEAESGRIWWMYDRHPGGSAPFLWERIPDDQWMDMTFDVQEGAWTATIPLEPAASTIEFFSNHGLVVYGFQTYLSSPYTRAELAGPSPPVGGIAELPDVQAVPLAAPESSGTHAPFAAAIAAIIAATVTLIAVGGAALVAKRYRATR